MGIGLLVVFSSPLYRGYQMGKIEEYKKHWIKTQVRDINNSEFNHLDEEDAPIYVKPRTTAEQFREEFSKMTR